MKTKAINKSIEINAPKEKIWDVLIKDELLRIWYKEFMEGSHAVTDWKEGSSVKFIDGSGNGMIGKVVDNDPYKVLSVELTGLAYKGKEDYESEEAKAVNGSLETYRLTEKGNNIVFSVETGMSEEYYDQMSASWDRALEKIKELSEN